MRDSAARPRSSQPRPAWPPHVAPDPRGPQRTGIHRRNQPGATQVEWVHRGGTPSWLYRKMGLRAGLGPYTHPWAAPKNPRAHISMFIHSINMSRAFGPIIVLISTCLQVRSRPYCMGMHLASTKGGYINFYRTYGPHFWRSIGRLDPSDSCYAKNEVRTCGRS